MKPRKPKKPKPVVMWAIFNPYWGLEHAYVDFNREFCMRRAIGPQIGGNKPWIYWSRRGWRCIKVKVSPV